MTATPQNDQIRRQFISKSTEYDRYQGEITLNGLDWQNQNKLFRMIFGDEGDFRAFAVHHGLLKSQVEGLWWLCVQMGQLYERLGLISNFGDNDTQTIMKIISGFDGTKLGQRLRMAYETPTRPVRSDYCDWTELAALDENDVDLVDCDSMTEAKQVLINWLDEADDEAVEMLPARTRIDFEKFIPEASGAVVLVIALILNPRDADQGYYDFLRLAVTGVAVYLALRAYRLKQTAWLWVMAGVALLYNPVFRVHLDRDDWYPLNALCAGMFLTYAYYCQRNSRR